MNNVCEAVRYGHNDQRKQQPEAGPKGECRRVRSAKKRSLQVVTEHFIRFALRFAAVLKHVQLKSCEPVFNNVLTTQATIQRFLDRTRLGCGWPAQLCRLLGKMHAGPLPNDKEQTENDSMPTSHPGAGHDKAGSGVVFWRVVDPFGKQGDE